MANIKFSAFTQKVAQADVDFLVGYTGADNVRITPAALGDGIYLPLGGGTMTGNIILNDNVQLKFGTSGAESFIYSDGSDTYFQANNGNLWFYQGADDKDIIFSCDDGAGGVTTYFQLDGGEARTVFKQNAIWEDNKAIYLGSAADLRLYHNATDSHIDNYAGNLNIVNNTDDGDINLYSDDGSGGVTPYLTLDGSAVETRFSKSTRHFDDVGAYFGDSADLQIYHDGSNSYIQDTGTGNLFIDGANNVQIRSATDSAVMASFSVGGPAYLYHGGSNKFNTTATGTLTTGQMDIAALNTAPASASGTGTLGEIRYTADYIYVCTATNTWKRTALSTW